MSLITNIILYPSSLTDFRLDARSPFGMPFMLVAYDYIRPKETDERVLSEMERVFDSMKIKPISVREKFAKSEVVTTFFKDKISLS